MSSLSQFLSLPSHFHPSSNHFSSLYHPFSHRNSTLFNCRPSFLCLAYTRKSRPSRKLVSDEELCKNLREFVGLIGLPEGHVPSTKELIDNGRKDLANIVRRRGHKLVKELLANSTETAPDGYTSQKNWHEEFNRSNVHEETDDLHGDFKLNNVEGQISEDNDNLVGHDAIIFGDRDFRRLACVSNNSSGLNGTLMLPRQIHPSTTEKRCARDIQSSTQRQPNTGIDEDMSIEARKMSNEVEVNRLKQMLKELELSQLKEEIEKEKQALTNLQQKAEDEISKAQKLISEKDAELRAAEESLSGLVEAKIQYTGEGQMVEVAGSFNGWHQKIKLEPQPSSVILDLSEYRSKLVTPPPSPPRLARMWPLYAVCI